MNRIIAAGLLVVLLIAGLWLSYTLGAAVTKKDMLIKQVKTVEAALAKQSKLQDNANHELQKQVDAKAVIADNLAADIERLRRERPTRPGVSTAPRATCSDANGAELDADNASFLVRYSSLAAIQQVELNTCRDMYNQAREAVKTQE